MLALTDFVSDLSLIYPYLDNWIVRDCIVSK